EEGPMRLLRLVTASETPAERGHEIGAALAQEIRANVDRYLAFFAVRGLNEATVRAVAESSLTALGEWSPGLAQELRSTAEAAGVEPWRLAALNARTEVLAVVGADREGECSTAIYAPPGAAAPQTIQTWDWHASLCPAGLLLELVPDSTSPERRVGRVRLFTELGMLGKIGVNDAGIGVHFNILHHASDHPRGGVPVHAIARRILDEATSIAEAEAIARSARVSASTVLTVVSLRDEHPRAVCLELSPERVSVLTPDDAHWLLHTNHFRHPDQEPGEATPDVSTTYVRLDHVAERVADMANVSVQERGAQMCGPAGGNAPVCFVPNPADPPHEQWTTLLTISLDLAAARLDVVAGNPALLAATGPSRF
ncbi:C45 family peptidase, partial [Leucobacter sp. M11]|uniref:C45 family peptidase n=1 Tax=Leucobacter sp. M11 TaxID=2993565 RepID=UPI002D808247